MNTRRIGLVLALVSSVPGAEAGQRAAPAPVQPARYAVVVGQNLSDRAGRDDLEFADDDAVRIHLMLEQAGATSLLLVSKDAATQALYPDVQPFGPPTRANLERAFAAVAAAMQEATAAELIFFFSGHGNVERGQGTLVLEGGRLTRTGLVGLLAAARAEQMHVIIDACRSYYMAFEKAPGGRRKPYQQPFVSFAETGGAERTGFILSTSADRRSHEWERYQAGVFSHEMVSGLRGAADADCDGRVTYAEMGAFLQTANEGIESPRLRPAYFVRPPGRFPGDMARVLLSWPESYDVIEIDVANLGHVYLEDARGRRILDLHPDEDQTFRLTLPPGRPVFVRKVGGTQEWVVEGRGPVALSGLEQRPVAATRTKGAVERALDRLFVLPFGRADVRAYLDQFSRVGLWARSLAEARVQRQPTVPRVERRVERGPGALGIAKWSSVGLTAAAGTAAAFFGVLADKDAEAARGEIWGSDAWRRKADMARENSRASNILAGVAAAAGVAAVVLFILDALDDEDISMPASGNGSGSFGISF